MCAGVSLVGPPPVLAPCFSIIASFFISYLLSDYLFDDSYSFFITYTLYFSVLAFMLELMLFFTAIGEL